MDEERPVVIKIKVTPRKLAKLNEIMPDHEKNGDTNKAIYWAIDEVIRNATAKPLQTEVRQQHSNREYFKR